MSNRAETHCVVASSLFCSCVLIIGVIIVTSIIVVAWHALTSSPKSFSDSLDCEMRGPAVAECKPLLGSTLHYCLDGNFTLSNYWAKGRDCAKRLSIIRMRTRTVLVTAGFDLKLNNFSLQIDTGSDGAYLVFVPHSNSTDTRWFSGIVMYCVYVNFVYVCGVFSGYSGSPLHYI